MDIPAQGASLTYSSFLLYLVTQDVPVTLTNVVVTVFDGPAPEGGGEEAGGEEGGPIAGCQDPAADNYNPDATTDGELCSYPVTFTIDTSCSGLDTSGGVFLNGSFNGWCGDCWAMEDMGGGVFQITESFAPGIIEYKYTIGTEWEALDACGDCVVSINNGEFVNRTFTTPAEAAALSVVSFGSCNACGEAVCEESERRKAADLKTESSSAARSAEP